MIDRKTYDKKHSYYDSSKCLSSIHKFMNEKMKMQIYANKKSKLWFVCIRTNYLIKHFIAKMFFAPKQMESK